MIWFTTTAASAEGPLKIAGSQFEPIKWADLAGWTADDHLAAFAAYQASCQVLLKLRRIDERGEISGALSNVCRKAAQEQPQNTEAARAFFEQNFQPVRIGRLGEAEGLLTGYFEPIVAGSRFPTPEFHVPLYRRPRDLEAAGYKPGSLAFPNNGVRIGRRNEKNELVPYYDRAAIDAGALDGQKLEICWLRSSLDLLAIQIEGSGRVILEDGTPLRVAFDSHNGYAFSSIERVLIDRNIIARKDISTHAIRDWMAAHPDEAAKVRAANRSYVFFRVTGLTNEHEPLGAQGVPLTPGRSIAVDRLHPYGTPFFIEAELPIEGEASSPFRRLMIAQDTGSAIVGPARADLYWGAGEAAGRIAGRIRHPGRFVMLLPRQLDIAATGRETPLPVPKPNIAELDVGKEGGRGQVAFGDTGGKGNAKAPGIGAPAAGKTIRPRQPTPKIAAVDVKKRDDTSKTTLDVKRQDDKGKASSASAGMSATGRQKPSPLPNTKIAVLDSEKPDSKRKAEGTNVGASATGKLIVLPVLKPKNSATGGKRRDAEGSRDGKDTSSATKSKSATTEVKNQNGKGKGKGKREIRGASSTALAAGLHKLSPSPKSKITEIEAKKQNGKGHAEKAAVGDKQKSSPAANAQTAVIDARKQDGIGGTVGVSSTTIAAGLHKGLPTPKWKSSKIEARKQNSKGKGDPRSLGETAAGDKMKPTLSPKSKPLGIEAKKPNDKGRAEAGSAAEDTKAPAKSSRQAVPTRKSYRS
jgi:membrane-bound lytic murein transglycosylase A